MITKRRKLRAGTTVWEANTPHSLLATVQHPAKHYDVVIIGAGVTGALSAEALSVTDLSILVLDRRGPALGSTAASTALIQWEIDQPLRALAKKIGAASARSAYVASYAAVRSLKAKIQRLGLRCDMVPRDTLLIAGNQMGAVALKREMLARKAASLPSRFLDKAQTAKQFGFNRAGSILSKGSIELDPRKLALELLHRATKRGVDLLWNTNVVTLESAKAGVFLTLDTGAVVAASKVIVATGYETLPEIPKHAYKLISTWALTTVRQNPATLWPRRALVWEAADPYLYFRTTVDNRIIVGGEDAEFLDPQRRDRQILKKSKRILEKFGQLMPGVELRAEYAWAGTFADSPTGLPVIGPVEDLHNVFAILGAGGNGITFSVIASDLAKAWVTGKSHRLSSLFEVRSKRKGRATK